MYRLLLGGLCSIYAVILFSNGYILAPVLLILFALRLAKDCATG